jgi:hypothetical protein
MSTMTIWRSHEPRRSRPRPLSHPSGVRGKKRPAVVVQSDAYNQAVKTVVVAEVTKNLTIVGDPACLFIDVNTLEGLAKGLKLFGGVLPALGYDRRRPSRSSSRRASRNHEEQPQRLPEGGAGRAVTDVQLVQTVPAPLACAAGLRCR